jgi:hypothetical protein
MSHIFISYPDKEENIVSNLRGRLQEYGIEAWIYSYNKTLAQDIWKEIEDKIDMYIFSADYLFVVAGEAVEVTKYYGSGIEGKSLIETKNNIYVANERLKMDYERLREANIIFLDKFWD